MLKLHNEGVSVKRCFRDNNNENDNKNRVNEMKIKVRLTSKLHTQYVAEFNNITHK